MKQLRSLELKRFNKSNQKHNKKIVLILENIQYATNIAGIFRTADAIKVEKIFLTGISLQPPFGKDLQKASRQKEKSVQWEYHDNSGKIINKYKKNGYQIVGVEITDESVNFNDFEFADKVCLVLGSETYGIVKTTLERLDASVFIPMYGKGASLNVGVAAAVTLFKIVE